MHSILCSYIRYRTLSAVCPTFMNLRENKLENQNELLTYHFFKLVEFEMFGGAELLTTKFLSSMGACLTKESGETYKGSWLF